jgi:uncharacterized protein with HEPN domain
MAERRPKLLFDALGAITAARSFVEGVRFEDYAKNLLLRSAVERQLEILGEACTRLASIDAGLFENVPKARLAIGMRNRIIHGYDAIDDETVFLTVLQDLEPMSAQLQSWLDRLTG